MPKALILWLSHSLATVAMPQQVQPTAATEHSAEKPVTVVTQLVELLSLMAGTEPAVLVPAETRLVDSVAMPRATPLVAPQLAVALLRAMPQVAPGRVELLDPVAQHLVEPELAERPVVMCPLVLPLVARQPVGPRQPELSIQWFKDV